MGWVQLEGGDQRLIAIFRGIETVAGCVKSMGAKLMPRQPGRGRNRPR